MQAGTHAVGAEGDLLGLNGDPKQQSALDALKASPLYQSLYRNGQEAVLQNASATGGLRGGNTERSLADFGADTFATTIQQQLANLGGISGQGAGVSTNLGALGSSMAGTIGNLLVGQGQSRAGAILGRRQVSNNTISGLLSGIGGILGNLDFSGGIPSRGY